MRGGFFPIIWGPGGQAQTLTTNYIDVASKLTEYTPTLNVGITNTVINKAFWSRFGSYMMIQGIITFNGAGGAGALVTVALPSGYTIATANLPAGTADDSTSSLLGSAEWFDSGTASKYLFPRYAGASTIKFNENPGALLDNALASGDAVKYCVFVPITGW